MKTIFTEIIQKKIPSHIIYEDDLFISILDKYPVVLGHSLIIIKKVIDNILEIEDDKYIKFQLLAKKISIALTKTFFCKRIAMSVIGLDVPHAHIHLLPINTIDDFNFSKKIEINNHRLKIIANSIINFL
ncbi:MAG: HIT domain-containing protein [Bacteroides sp.]|nr:MAG: HIT domain-containing protein [Bacteroides sp.]